MTRRDYEGLARDMLGPWLDERGPRALRISALYAALFLEDPLTQSWAGLASFVSHEVYLALQLPSPVAARFAEGNLLIYQSMMPNLLRFRDGAPISGPLAEGFGLLAAADHVARLDGVRAERLAGDAVEALSLVEQRDVARTLYASMSSVMGIALSQIYLFRLGRDGTSPVVRFAGRDIRDVEERLTWVRGQILPAWTTARRERMERLRADADRTRRSAGVRMEHLPTRWIRGEPPGTRP